MIIHSAKKKVRLLSRILKKFDIKEIIISPGSRNAPLIIEFTGQDFFKNYSIVDERSAAFFALGIAQQQKYPSILVCTSGSALLNYYPAIAEAFYSKIPLIIISADRPQKWVDQGEGQTIRQHEVFKNHSYFNTTLENQTHEQINDTIEKAIKISIEKQGPIHINIPFDEPLYETIQNEEEKIIPKKYQLNFPEIPEKKLQKLLEIWNQSKNKIILAGQHYPSDFLQKQLEKLSQDKDLIVLTENISNLHHEQFINNIDQTIFGLNNQSLSLLKPDLLITVGRNIISKKIKQFLRKYKPKHHWHIEITDIAPNTYEALTEHINSHPEIFFSQFLFLIYDQMKKDGTYQNQWLAIKNRNKKRHRQFLEKTPFSDLKIFDFLEKNIPENFMIQWSNSSEIRYAQLFDFRKSIIHFSNRGTSGIDGSSSTAIGAAKITEKPTLLISGDLSFLYDSNGLWNKYIPNHFKAIVINNGGGEIFNFIPGPSKTQALNDFFVTKHSLKIKKMVEMFQLKYIYINNSESLKEKFPDFINNHSKPQIMEIDTSEIANYQILKDYFEFLFDNSK